MTLSFESAPSVAGALISFRGDSARSIAMAADIKPANLSMWLSGKPQIISQKRVVGLLGCLDIVGGSLLGGKIHNWSVHENFDSLNLVLSNLLTEEQRSKSVICSDGASSFPYTRVLGLWSDAGWVWVALSVQAGIATAPLLCCADLGFGNEYILPIDFKSLPLDDCAKVEEILLSAINALGIEAGRRAVKSSVPIDLVETDYASPTEVSDVATLKITLQKVVDAGVSPKEIIQLLEDKFLS